MDLLAILGHGAQVTAGAEAGRPGKVARAHSDGKCLGT